MKNHFAPLALAALSVASGSCVENEQSLVILHFAAATTSNMCTIDANTMIYIEQGRFDTALASDFAPKGQPSFGYFVTPVIQNNLIERATMVTAERDYIQVNGFHIEFRAAPNSATALPFQPKPYTVPVAGGIAMPMGGRIAFAFEAIPPDLAQQLGAAVSAGWDGRLMLHMHALGTHSGGSISSGSIDFPVTVCQHCLGDPNQACPGGGFNPLSVQNGGCFTGAQDAPITCCTMGKQFVCGPGVPTTTNTPPSMDAGTH